MEKLVIEHKIQYISLLQFIRLFLMALSSYQMLVIFYSQPLLPLFQLLSSLDIASIVIEGECLVLIEAF